MKKIIALLLVAVMALSLCACGSKKEEKKDAPGNANMPNPMHESNADEFSVMAGELMLPAGCEDITYHTIDTEHKIYQVKFKLNDCVYCYRISDDDELTDTSGMYYEWKETSLSSVDGRDATVSWIEGEQGIIYWYDVVPGLNYSLSMDAGASFDALVDMANNIFVPVQGEVG